MEYFEDWQLGCLQCSTPVPSGSFYCSPQCEADAGAMATAFAEFAVRLVALKTTGHFELRTRWRGDRLILDWRPEKTCSGMVPKAAVEASVIERYAGASRA